MPIDVELRVDVGSIDLSLDAGAAAHPGQMLEFGPIEAGVGLFGGDTRRTSAAPAASVTSARSRSSANGGAKLVTSDEALLLLGESVADAIVDFLRSLAPTASRAARCRWR